MPFFGKIRAWFLKRRLAAPREYAQFLRKSSWRLGSVPQTTPSSVALKSDDRDVLVQLENIIQATRSMKSPYDALDLAEALMIKGFIFRVRGVDVDGIFGAWAQLNDSIKVCRVILNQVPSAEAADILSQAALYLSEIKLAIAENELAIEEFREEGKRDAKEYLEECVEWSQQLENESRVNAAKQLLGRLHLLDQKTIECPRCKKLFERPNTEIPKDAVRDGIYEGKPVAEVMTCRMCRVMYCWPGCCKMQPCVCGSTQGFVSQPAFVVSR